MRYIFFHISSFSPKHIFQMVRVSKLGLLQGRKASLPEKFHCHTACMGKPSEIKVGNTCWKTPDNFGIVLRFFSDNDEQFHDHRLLFLLHWKTTMESCTY